MGKGQRWSSQKAGGKEGEGSRVQAGPSVGVSSLSWAGSRDLAGRAQPGSRLHAV